MPYHSNRYQTTDARMLLQTVKSLILFVCISLFILACSGPVEFDRDNPADPEGGSYRIQPPASIQAIAKPNGHIELSWPQPDADMTNLLGYIIEKYDWRKESFVQFDSIGSVFSYTDSSFTYSMPETKYQIRPVFRRMGEAASGEVTRAQVQMGNIGSIISNCCIEMNTWVNGRMVADIYKNNAVYYDGVKISRLDGSRQTKEVAAFISYPHPKIVDFPYDQDYFKTVVITQAYILDQSDTLWYPELTSRELSNFRPLDVNFSINREDGLLLTISNTFRKNLQDIRVEFYNESKSTTEPIGVAHFSDFKKDIYISQLIFNTELVYNDRYLTRIQLITPHDTSITTSRSVSFNVNAFRFFYTNFTTINDVDLQITLTNLNWNYISELTLLRTDNISPPVAIAATTQIGNFAFIDTDLDTTKSYSYLVRSRYQESWIPEGEKRFLIHRTSARMVHELPINRPSVSHVTLEPFHCYLRDVDRLLAGGSTSSAPSSAGNVFRDYDLTTNQIVFEHAAGKKVQRIWCDPDQSRYAVVMFDNGDIWLYDSLTRSVIAENFLGSIHVFDHPDVWIQPSADFVLLRVSFNTSGNLVTNIIKWDIPENVLTDESIPSVPAESIRGFVSLPGKNTLLLSMKYSDFHELDPYTLEVQPTPAFSLQNYYKNYVISDDQKSLYLVNRDESLKIDIHSLSEISRMPIPDNSRRVFEFYGNLLTESGRIYNASGELVGITDPVSHVYYNPLTDGYYYYHGGWGRLYKSGRWVFDSE